MNGQIVLMGDSDNYNGTWKEGPSPSVTLGIFLLVLRMLFAHLPSDDTFVQRLYHSYHPPI